MNLHQLNNKTTSGDALTKSGDTQLQYLHRNRHRFEPLFGKISKSGDSGDSGGFIPTLQEGADGLNTNVLPDSYVAFDFEWSSSNNIDEHAGTSIENKVTAAAFVDNQGNRKVLHISDFS